MRQPSTRSLADALRINDPDLIEFMRGCFEWKPEKRLTPEQAFSHPFISQAVNELKCLKEQPPQGATPQSGFSHNNPDTTQDGSNSAG